MASIAKRIASHETQAVEDECYPSIWTGDGYRSKGDRSHARESAIQDLHQTRKVHNNALVGYYASGMHPEPVQSFKQVCQLQRQIFGRKSERRLLEPDGVQGMLGESEAMRPNRRSKIAAHEHIHKPKPKRSTDGADE